MLALKGETLSWVQWHAVVDGNSHGSCAVMVLVLVNSLHFEYDALLREE
jgi:hypothetical protein